MKQPTTTKKKGTKMRAFDKMTEVSPNIRKAGEKSYYIQTAPGIVKYCSDVRLEKLRVRAGKKDGMTPEQLLAIDAEVVKTYRKRTEATAPNVAVTIPEVKPEVVVPPAAPASEAIVGALPEVKPEAVNPPVTILDNVTPTTATAEVVVGAPEVVAAPIEVIAEVAPDQPQESAGARSRRQHREEERTGKH